MEKWTVVAVAMAFQTVTELDNGVNIVRMKSLLILPADG